MIPEFRITAVVVFLFFFSKNEEEAIPPGGKKILGTTKASTRMILVHVQKMYKTCTEDVQYNINRVNGSVKVRGQYI